MKCLHCERMTLRDKTGRPHAMARHLAGLCTARKAGGVQCVYVGLMRERQCAQFRQAGADVIESRMRWVGRVS